MKKFIIKVMLFTFLLAITASVIGQTGKTRPGAASGFENNFLIQQNQSVKPSGYMTDLAISDALQAGADRLVVLQNNDGGWDWPLDDGDPSNTSPVNTIGPIAMGLAQSYLFTNDPAHLAALSNAGALLLSKTNNFSPSDGYLANELDQIFGVTTYSTHVNTNFYGPLAAGTYDRNGAGTLYSTAGYVNLIRTARASQGIANLAAWDIGMGLVGAASCGAATTDWIAGVKGEIDEIDGAEYYDVIGLAGAVYSLAFVGEDFDPTTGEHAAASNINDLGDILANYQINFGGFAWNSDYVIPDDGNENNQETAYAILALNELDRDSYLANISGASSYMKSVQLGTGGWEGYVGEGENNELTAEVMWGIAVAFGPETTIQTPTSTACGDYYFPVTVKDFFDVGAISLILNYDPLVFEYQDVTLHGSLPVSGANGSIAGKFIYGDFPTPALSIDDDEILFTLHLKLLPAISGGTTDLTWSTVPGDCEYAGPNGSPIYSSTFNDLSWTIPVRPVMNTTTMLEYCSIKEGIADAVSDEGLLVAAVTLVETGQIVIDKNLTITGAGMGSTIVKTDQNTGSSGDARGWFLVNSGIEFHLSDLTLDGAGYDIYQGIRQIGSGTIDQVEMKNMVHPGYAGVGVAAFGTGNVHITNSTFANMGRVGVLYFGATITGSNFHNNIYTGKGSGDWLDYMCDISNGAIVDVKNCTVTENKGVASSDGSTSAGILVTTYFGPGTTATITDCDISLNTTGIAVGYDHTDGSVVTANNNNIYNNVTYGVSSTNPTVDATLNWWGDVSGPSGVAYGSGDAVSDYVEYCPWLDASYPGGAITSNILNTSDGTVWCSIQDAIDNAATGDVITVAPGVYNESLNIPVGITLLGANAGVACNSRGTESVIAPASGIPFTVTADGVTINGFEITAPTSYNAIVCGNTSSLDVVFNNIHHIGTTATGGNVHSINYTVANLATTNDVTISDNCFDYISSSSLTGYSASAIGILQSTSTGVLTDLYIERNTIGNINVNTGTWPTGKIAYGIQLNVGGGSGYLTTTGKVVNAAINDNEISIIEGFIATAIALEGNTEDATVMNNDVSSLTGYKLAARSGGGYDLQALKFENNRYVETCTVENNNFNANTFVYSGTPNLGYAIANYVPVGLTYSGGTTGEAYTECNWHGTAVYDEITDNATLTGKIFNKDNCATNFLPFWTGSNGPCDGLGPVVNVTKGTSYMTIQAAVLDVNPLLGSNDIQVVAGTYFETGQIVIDNDMTITGIDKATTIIKPDHNTTGGYYAPGNGWIYVEPGITFGLYEVTLDGRDLLDNSQTIQMAIQSRGELTVESCNIQHIYSSQYDGRGIVTLAGTSNYINDVSMNNIQRIGIHIRGGVEPTNPYTVVENFTYTGKGAGVHLDYGIEFGGGGQGIVGDDLTPVTGCYITNCYGIADDAAQSESAGILVTDYYGTFTIAEIYRSEITDNLNGIMIGYADTDISVVTANNNKIHGNSGIGMSALEMTTVDAEYNWWGDVTGPYNDPNNTCGLGDIVSDYVDFYPWWADAAMTTPGSLDPIVFTCPTTPVTVNVQDDKNPFATGYATGTNCHNTIVTYSDNNTGLTGCNATGTIVRTWSAVDYFGQTDACMQTIIVVDIDVPAITCPANIEVDNDDDVCGAAVNFEAIATDNSYFQGFEDPNWVAGASTGSTTTDWNNWDGNIYRVPSGTDGITSKTGVAHAVLDTNGMFGEEGAFTKLGGFGNNFYNGYIATADVYIDLADASIVANEYGFDMSVASNNQAGSHLQDFIFHFSSNIAGNVYVAASNNSAHTRTDLTSIVNKYEITSSGWYSMEWDFRNDGAGILAVDCKLFDELGNLLFTETRTTPDNIIATVVGGNRYMWLLFLEATNNLALDNTAIMWKPNIAYAPYSSGDVIPVGTTTITATATDICGNANTCTFDITVNDTQDPEITTCAPAQSAIVTNACQVAMPDFMATTVASDNCGFTLSQVPAVGTMMDYQATPYDVTITATDAAGNFDECTSTLTVERIILDGTLTYHNGGQPIGDVILTLWENSTFIKECSTNAAGYYEMADLCAGTYTLEADFGPKPVGGINSTDAAQVNAWGAGPQYEIEMVRFFAGDATPNSYVDANDAGRILTYFVSAGNPPMDNPWSFWKAGQTINGTPSWGGLTIPSITIGGGDETIDLLGQVTGDFNMSYSGASKAASETLLLKEGKNILAEVGTELELPIVAGMDMDLGAVSLILNFPADKLEISEVFFTADPTSPVMYNIAGDELRIAWTSLIPVYLTEGESLITLNVKVIDEAGTEGISLSLVADPLNELAHGDYAVISDALLVANVIHTSALGLANYMADELTLANIPNPFRESTSFVYSIPEAGRVMLDIFDLVGNKVMTVIDETQTAGEHTYKLQTNRLQPGVYTAYLRLSNEDSKLVRTIKIICR